MRHLAIARRALPLTFAIYALEALLALLGTLPGALELAAARDGGVARWDASQSALFLESLLERAPAGRTALVALALALGTALLLGPFLQMSWLAALEAPRPLFAALALGAARTGRAYLVSLLVALAGVLACAPVLLLAYLLERAHIDARTHDLAMGGALLLLLPIGFVTHVLHDLARARALHRPARRAVREGLSAALRPRVLTRALGLFALGASFVLASQVAASLSPSAGLLTALCVPLLESALLARLFLRSYWLACALSEMGKVAGEE